MQTTFQDILNTAVKTTIAAVSLGRTAGAAMAESLEEAAAKLRSGELRVDDAVARARTQQSAIDTARSKLINDG